MAAGTQPRNEASGLVYGALCAVNGAFVPAVAKLTTERADPVLVAAVTTGFAGVAALLVLAQRGELPRLVERAQRWTLLLIGLLGTALPFLLFFYGASRTSAIEAVLCLQTEPVYSLLLAWGVLGHRLTRRRVVAATGLLLGIALAVGGGGARGDAAGIAALLAAPLCWQLSHLVTLKRLAGLSPPLLTGARHVYGSLWLAAALLVLGPAELPAAADLAGQLPLLAVQGVLLTYSGTMLWYMAIARLDLARTTAIVVPSIPVLSLAASFAVVGEVPSPRQAAGMALTVAGVLAFVRAPHAVERRERIPSATAPLAVPADPVQGGDEA